MAAGDLVTENYQIEFNNVLLDTSNGMELERCSLFSAPQTRQKSLDRPLDQGAFSSSAYYTGRTVQVDFEVWGETESEFQTNLVKALNLTELTEMDIPWVFQLPGFGKLYLEGKCVRRDVAPVDIDFAVGYKAKITSDYWFPNPRILSATQGSKSIAKSTAAGGMTYDIVYPISYGSLGSGTNSITNSGSYETRPLCVIQGPITAPVLENVTVGKSLAFSGTLGATDTLTVDFYTRQVLLNGTASRYGWIIDVTQWWTLAPGINEVRLNGSTAGAPTATFTWRSAWM